MTTMKYTVENRSVIKEFESLKEAHDFDFQMKRRHFIMGEEYRVEWVQDHGVVYLRPDPIPH